ncbi:unnamed protein product [Amoebophrya sp. A120]|nr:unnamed protein product [Amoebophrya sp. A120]|eukprot:GSA120T00021293001.1
MLKMHKVEVGGRRTTTMRGRIRPAYLPFEQAREEARKLGFRKCSLWWQWHKENQPPGLPSTPHRVYAKEGWRGFPDFLGYTLSRKRQRPLPPPGEHGRNRFLQRVEAMDFVQNEVRKTNAAASNANANSVVDLKLLPFNCSASFLFRPRSITKPENEKGKRAEPQSDLWMPILLRSSKDAQVVSVRSKCCITDRGAPDDRVDTPVVTAQHPSHGYRFWRCNWFKRHSHPEPCGPLVCVAARQQKMFLFDTTVVGGLPIRFILPSSAAVKSRSLNTFLLEQWNLHAEKRRPFGEWLIELSSSTYDTAIHDGIVTLRKLLYDQLRYDFSFCPNEQQSGPSVCNAYVGAFRTVHRRAHSFVRGSRAGAGLKVLLATPRRDGIVFSGLGRNIDLLDFLIVFHGPSAQSQLVNGVFIIPREILFANLGQRAESFLSSLMVYPPSVTPKLVIARKAQRWQIPFYVDLSGIETDKAKAARALAQAQNIFDRFGRIPLAPVATSDETRDRQEPSGNTSSPRKCSQSRTR